MDVHDELHRWVLRRRWVRWYLRHWRPGGRPMLDRMLRLSARLTRWRPTWTERQREGVLP